MMSFDFHIYVYGSTFEVKNEYNLWLGYCCCNYFFSQCVYGPKDVTIFSFKLEKKRFFIILLIFHTFANISETNECVLRPDFPLFPPFIVVRD